jgi:hypothetical protein
MPDAHARQPDWSKPARLPPGNERPWREPAGIAPVSPPISCEMLAGGMEGALARVGLGPMTGPAARPLGGTPPGGSPLGGLAPASFISTEPWREKRIGAVAIYCSDGRWGDAVDEFCHRGLGIPAYDRFAVPGGPAWIAQGAAGRAELARAARDQLGFLITHWGCAFYGHALGRCPEECLATQLQDVSRAAAAVRDWFGPLSVEGYLANRTGGSLTFHDLCI